MKTQIGDNVYSIEFRYGEKNGWHYAKREEVIHTAEFCTCRIVQKHVTSGEENVVAEHSVTRYHKDHSSRDEARRYALLMAVNTLWPKGIEYKTYRGAILGAYFNRKKNNKPKSIAAA